MGSNEFSNTLILIWIISPCIMWALAASMTKLGIILRPDYHGTVLRLITLLCAAVFLLLTFVMRDSLWSASSSIDPSALGSPAFGFIVWFTLHFLGALGVMIQAIRLSIKGEL